jgi:hypothetical protein
MGAQVPGLRVRGFAAEEPPGTRMTKEGLPNSYCVADYWIWTQLMICSSFWFALMRGG